MTVSTEQKKSIREFLTSGDAPIANKLFVKKDEWTAVRSTRDNYPYQEEAGNPEAFGAMIQRRLERALAVKVAIVSTDCKLGEFEFTAKFTVEPAPIPEPAQAEALSQEQAEQLYAEVIAKLGGNSKGTFRVEAPSGEAVEQLAVAYYHAVRRFCETCTCNWRALKADGLYSISMAIGNRIAV